MPTQLIQQSSAKKMMAGASCSLPESEARPGGDGRRGGKQDGHSKLLRQPGCAAMNREQIEQSKDRKIRVVAQCLRTHVGED